MVEDNKADVFLIREALNSAGVKAELMVVPDGERAIQYFADVDEELVPCPQLILLDINLPKRHGSEVLRHMRTTRRCAKSKVVVVTSSDSEQDRAVMAELGADEYFHKSSEYRDYLKLGNVVKKLLS